MIKRNMNKYSLWNPLLLLLAYCELRILLNKLNK